MLLKGAESFPDLIGGGFFCYVSDMIGSSPQKERKRCRVSLTVTIKQSSQAAEF